MIPHAVEFCAVATVIALIARAAERLIA